MKEKIKKIVLIILYGFLWLLLILSFFGIFAGLSDIENIKKWELFLAFTLLPILSIYLLRKHIMYLKNNFVALLKFAQKRIMNFSIDKIMEKLNKLSLPAVILIASIILGGFYFATQVIKQQSIERQQEVKRQEDRREKEIKNALEALKIKQAECEALAEGVREKWNNVMGVTYDRAVWKECVVTYTDTETGKVEISPLRLMETAK